MIDYDILNTKKKRFTCENCKGWGWVEKWIYTNKGRWLELNDCDVCSGKGYLMYNVKDSRDKSKNMKLKHRYE